METITSVKNERVKAAAKLTSSTKARREQGLFVLEGLRLCMDVVRSGLRCAELFVSEEFCAKHGAEYEALAACSDEVFLVSDAVLEKLSDTRTPQGVCCVVRMAAPVSLLDPQPGERICDLCAAPGGKSTQIAGRLKGEGFLLCNEYSPKRAKILSRNIERLGIANALVTNETPQNLAKHLSGYFHRVLIDAPCSGEGMFRKEEAAITDWGQETVEMCAARQAEILDAGAKLLCPGGRLVYSTCTFAPEENEQAVAAFLEYPRGLFH